ncbi:uncharacterized protein B0J16DRAFT_372739 [Fusarium flagelliforme]|uniref:uncharacterized protein n=1 Tax=Fusarium flagelliforme TaxID=2675880 RepID=UPI001E8DEAB0|nr:uncharacterized protein B0J16DRAFT_372739 [Fusarium flagelliforme]KAH7186009.1 hypothetical protein B0J16DRAFT_372739 [Fusarium flagelliforme]
MTSQPFVLKEGEEANFSFAPTPTYLFRLYTPKSKGRTSANHVSSPASLNRRQGTRRIQYPSWQDILQLPPEIAAPRLSAHLLWGLSGCGGCCNLMSWSSSLLLVLQYGLYRHNHWRDRSPLSEMFIIMIDTRGFPQRTFLRDLDALEYYFKLPKLDADLETLKRLRLPGKETYFGEYLTQGYLEIEGHCCQVSMQQLIDTGLFKLCTFSDWDNWANPVLTIRRDYFLTEETDIEQTRLAILMGLINMEPRFAFPFAAMLLSLRARDTKDETTRNGMV